MMRSSSDLISSLEFSTSALVDFVAPFETSQISNPAVSSLLMHSCNSGRGGRVGNREQTASISSDANSTSGPHTILIVRGSVALKTFAMGAYEPVPQ